MVPNPVVNQEALRICARTNLHGQYLIPSRMASQPPQLQAEQSLLGAVLAMS